MDPAPETPHAADADERVRRHRRLTQLFLEARALPEAEREGWIDVACAETPGLAQELRELLAGDGEEGALSEAALRGRSPADRLRALEGEDTVDPSVLPERIGPFTPRAVLGRGGMAVVYLAEQDAPRRDVALKVLRGDASGASADRLEREAAVLARLEHPAIAKVFAAGRARTPWGEQSYLALELVNGRPLLEFAREEDLGLRARLELVALVAEALQAAHAAGVVHRDLKSSNVLVQRDGAPKLLDFGVARGTGLERGETAHTRTGQIVGTLATMAPEQAAGAGDVDARADVYALGVLLYELLSGRPPVDTSGLPLHEAVRRIQEEEPVPLCTRVPSVATDVETVTHAALRKDPARRYSDAGAFAADLRRALEDRPILARPQRVRDHVGRFVRRHRTLVGVVSVAFVALLVALFASLYLLERARDENRRAGRVREAALRLTDLRRLDRLEEGAEELWPADAERVPALEAWWAEAELLAGKLDWHRELLAKLDERLASPGGRARLALDDTLAAQITDELWMREAQVELVGRLEGFLRPEGTFERLRARLDLARAIGAGPTQVEDWTHAGETLFGFDGALSAEAGFSFPPHPELVPVGPDRATGLWTFRARVLEPPPDADLPRSWVFLPLPPLGDEPAVYLQATALDGSFWDAFDGVPCALDTADGQPVALVSHAEASEFARRFGARLPTAGELRRLDQLGLREPFGPREEWVRSAAEPEGGEATVFDFVEQAPCAVSARRRTPELTFRLAFEVHP